MLPASLLVGCEGQLATQDSYFGRTDPKVAAHGSQVRELVRYNRSRHAVRRSCLLPGSRGVPADAPDLRSAGGSEALAELCAASPAPAPQAQGGILNAYGRWLEDEIRRLPTPGSTAERAGG